MEKEFIIIDTEFYHYEGETVNNLPDGKGHMDYLNDDFFICYDGYFEEGIENGHGKQVTIDGTVECEFINGHPKGIGTFLFPEGDFYEGEIDEVPEGKGKITYADGSVYEGEFHNGFPEGEGTITNSDGSIIHGIFDSAGLVREC